MEIYQGRRTVGSPERFEIREAYQVGHNDTIEISRVFYLLNKVERRSSHPPFPETGGKSDKFEPVTGMLHPAIGKVSMGAAVEWLKKEEVHQ